MPDRFAVLVVARTSMARPCDPPTLVESLAFAWAGMMLLAYRDPAAAVPPHFRTLAQSFAGFFTVAALMARPLVLALNFLHSLLDIVKQEPRRRNRPRPPRISKLSSPPVPKKA